MSIIRVKEGVQATVFDPRTESYVTLVQGIEFDTGDPLVKEQTWAFETDAEADGRTSRRSSARRTEVETATAEPGEKRNR